MKSAAGVNSSEQPYCHHTGPTLPRHNKLEAEDEADSVTSLLQPVEQPNVKGIPNGFRA